MPDHALVIVIDNTIVALKDALLEIKPIALECEQQ